jgi:nucleoside-diphosphate-sugar epimerase
MNAAQPEPRRILLAGSSGLIGQAVMRLLCGEVQQDPVRVTLLQHEGTGRYRVVASGHLNLEQGHALRPWFEEAPDAVVYLAGVPAESAGGPLGERVNFGAFLEVLDTIEQPSRSVSVVYASSTAVHALSESEYGQQKLRAERALVASGVPGFALRFPTVLPRIESESRTSALNESLRNALRGHASTWNVSADRRMRVMSVNAAARHVGAALSVGAGRSAVALDLPATIITPRSVCSAAAAPAPSIELDPRLEELMARRAVDVTTESALDRGFPAGESVDELLDALKPHLIA